MSQVIIKPDHDEDYYVLWSTVTDGPLVHGTRSEVGDYIRWLDAAPPELDARFERADAHGSSARGGYHFGWWDDDGFIVNWDHTGEHEIGQRWLPREHLGNWLRTGDESLTEPLDG